MRSIVEKIKKFYDNGNYTMSDIHKLRDNDKITQEELKYILGEDNKEV